MNIKVLDLFCGCGGFSQGFEEEGFDVLGVDLWDVALKTHGGNTLECNIAKLNKNNIPKDFSKPDIIIGSPPCQTFSTANRHSRLKDDTLIKHFQRLVRSLRPKCWVWENVMGSTTVQKGIILDAQFFGVAQRRRRNFVANFDISESVMNKYYKRKKNIKQTLPLSSIKGSGLLDGYNSKIYSLDDVSPTVRRIPLKWYDGRYDKTGLPKPLRFTGFDMLSIQDHLSLMGFSRRKKIFGNKSQQMIQIGNAVSPIVSRALAKRIKYLLSLKEGEVEDGKVF